MFLLCVVDRAEADDYLDGRAFAADGLGWVGAHTAIAAVLSAVGSAVRHGLVRFWFVGIDEELILISPLAQAGEGEGLAKPSSAKMVETRAPSTIEQSMDSLLLSFHFHGAVSY